MTGATVMKSLLFSRLSKVKPENLESYSSTFLTIDIDWADDEVINDTINIIERSEVEATWFVTHPTKIIDRLRENPKFELGIHPNFNSLLDSDARNGGDIRIVIEKLLEIVPEAKSLRSHSLFTSTKLLQLMPEYGLTHESNLYMPISSCDGLKPFRIWNDVVRIPHSFEDDLFLLNSKRPDLAEHESISNHIKRYFTNNNGIRVLDFHPIHIFLNTENLDRYEGTREIHRNPGELVKHRYAGAGARAALETLLGSGECA